MSYDLVAFDNTKVTTKETLHTWYEEETKWEKEINYDDVNNLTNTAMREFYYELIKIFPPMNGPMTPSDKTLDENPEIEEYLVDYSISDTMIYAAFAWSKEKEAYTLFKELSTKYNIGFYNCSTDDEVLF